MVGALRHFRVVLVELDETVVELVIEAKLPVHRRLADAPPADVAVAGK